MTTPSPSRASRLSSRLSARLGQVFSVAGGLLFVSVVWALVLYHLEHARTETVQQAENTAINLSVAISEQVARLVEGADSVMRMIGTAYASDPRAFDFAKWASAATGLHDAAMQVSLFDAAGDLVAMRSRDDAGIRKVNVADRDYFKALSTTPGAGLHVGRTIRARVIGGGYAFQLARRLERPDGSFAGVLVVSLSPQYLSDRFDDLDIGRDGSVALFGMDGYLRARYPAVPDMFERDLPQSVNQHVMYRSLAGSTKGSFQTPSAYDGVPRIYGYKALDGIPLVVSTGMAVETVMAPYLAERHRSILIGSGATLGAALFVLASLVETERRRRRMAALAEAHAAAAAAAEALRASGRALEDKTALLELAQNAAGAGTWDLDLAKRECMLSPDSARLHGLPEAETTVSVAEWKALCVAEDAERTGAVVMEAVAARRTMRSEFRVPRPDGTYRWVMAVGRATYADDGTPVRMIGLNLDITGRKEAEAALIRAKAEAEQASAAKSDFLATMSHEVRTPLNAVIGYTQILAESDGLAPDLRRHADRARSAGAALLAVVDDILSFSKIEAGQAEIRPVPFASRTLFDDCLSIVGVAAAGKPVAIDASYDPAIPETLVGDAGRLRQVLLNLLNNAVKFTDAGNVLLSVTREGTGPRGESILFTVEDTGIGISADRVDRLFVRFSQVDGSISRGYGGTGLGLAICKGLVEAMGGEIGVRSEPGRGSTFWFRLDLPRGQAPEAGPAPGEGTPLAGRLLVVEDVEVNQELARLVLETAGHAVDVVSCGAGAVEAVRAGAYDLVLMDVQMPGMDGMAATRLIRALDGPGRDIPIVAMTANVLPDEVAAFRESGMDDHVGKPVDRRLLLSAIERLLRRDRDAPSPEPPAAAGSQPTVADPAGLPVWDRQSFDEYTDWMPGHRVEKLLERFRERARSAIAGLPAASDDAAWGKEAHDMIYVAGTLGFVRLAAACRAMQAVIRKGGSPTESQRSGLLATLSESLEASDTVVEPALA